VHNVPQGSPYKGKNKMIMISLLAKSKGMMWSPWQGLFKRDDSGKKGEFISNDIDVVAKTLLGSQATSKDLGSVESMLAAMPKEQAAQLLATAKADQAWEELK
jgi:hypothetical protein